MNLRALFILAMSFPGVAVAADSGSRWGTEVNAGRSSSSSKPSNSSAATTPDPSQSPDNDQFGPRVRAPNSEPAMTPVDKEQDWDVRENQASRATDARNSTSKIADDLPPVKPGTGFHMSGSMGHGHHLGH